MRKSISNATVALTAWLPLVVGCSRQSELQGEPVIPPAALTALTASANNPPSDSQARRALDPQSYRSAWNAIGPGSEIPDYPENQGKKTWFAVSLVDNSAFFERVTERPSDWIWKVDRYAEPQGVEVKVEPPAKIAHQVVAMPAAALFAVRETDELATPVGKHRSLLTAPVMLQPDLKAAFEIGDEKWTLITDYVKDGDGQPLQGSLTLIAVRADGARQLLVPPVSGMAFAQQELLWLARGPSAATFDYILKRTLVTGVINYSYAFNGGTGFVAVDPDRPYQRFLSGDESAYTWEHTGHHPLQTRALPPSLNGAEFSINQEEWNAALTAAHGSTKRRVLFERDLKVKGEAIHFVVEYLPLYEGNDSDPGENISSVGEHLSIKSIFRGRAQVLLQVGEMADTFNARLDEHDGQAVIELNFSTEHNYYAMSQWVWSKEDGRFRRLLDYYASGC